MTCDDGKTPFVRFSSFVLFRLRAHARKPAFRLLRFFRIFVVDPDDAPSLSPLGRGPRGGGRRHGGGRPSGARASRLRRFGLGRPTAPHGGFAQLRRRTLSQSRSRRSDGGNEVETSGDRRLSPARQIVARTLGPAPGRRRRLCCDSRRFARLVRALELLAGLTIAINPVFGDASPVPGFGRPFPTTAPFGVDKLPALDLVVITHDHYDHLEYDTITALRDRVARFVCPLGVGMHLERWGVAPARILEADWWESIGVEGVCMTFTPSQHFSGRTFERDTTLWGGWMFEFADYVLYLSGDGGYGPHFREIKKRFPSIDLALLEDGQYNTDWKDIHLMPADWRRALEDLAPRAVFPTHHSKYALSTHGWKEPIEHAQASAAAVGVPLLTSSPP